MDSQTPTAPAIQPHTERAASVWSLGGRDYEEIIRGVYDGIDATVAGLAPQPGERILDVATGTGITARACGASSLNIFASSRSMSGSPGPVSSAATCSPSSIGRVAE